MASWSMRRNPHSQKPGAEGYRRRLWLTWVVSVTLG